MIIPSATTSSGPAARYMLAQYIPNLMRMEPRNIGVLVEKDGHIESKFLGESESGGWELSRLRQVSSLNAYRLWVDYWRKLARESGERWDSALLASVERDANFVVISGGEVTNTASDSPEDICQYLYALLVSSKGLSEALNEDSEQEAALRNDVASSFRQAGVMAGSSIARNPIRTSQTVKGMREWYQVAFYQEAGKHAWAMEPVDFTVTNKKGARDRAAYASFMFADFRERSRQNGLFIHTTAIVKANAAEAEHREVKRGLSILNENCDIVRWTSNEERAAFIKERVRVADCAF